MEGFDREIRVFNWQYFHGVTPGQPGVTHVLLGNKSAQQTISKAHAGFLRLDKEHMKRIDADLFGLGLPV